MSGVVIRCPAAAGAAIVAPPSASQARARTARRARQAWAVLQAVPAPMPAVYLPEALRARLRLGPVIRH